MEEGEDLRRSADVPGVAVSEDEGVQSVDPPAAQEWQDLSLIGAKPAAIDHP